MSRIMTRKTVITLLVDEDVDRPHGQRARLLVGVDGIAGPTVPTSIFAQTPHDVIVRFVDALALAVPKKTQGDAPPGDQI